MRDLTGKCPDYQDGYSDCLSDSAARFNAAKFHDEQLMVLHQDRFDFHKWIFYRLCSLYVVGVLGCTTFGLVWIYYSATVATIVWLSVLGLVTLVIGVLGLRSWAFNRWFQRAMGELNVWREVMSQEDEEPSEANESMEVL